MAETEPDNLVSDEVEAQKSAWLEENFPHGGDRKSRLPDDTLKDAYPKFEVSRRRDISFD